MIVYILSICYLINELEGLAHSGLHLGEPGGLELCARQNKDRVEIRATGPLRSNLEKQPLLFTVLNPKGRIRISLS